MLGMESFPVTKTFGAFWVLNGRIVGAFLEVEPGCVVRHSLSLPVEKIAESKLKSFGQIVRIPKRDSRASS